MTPPDSDDKNTKKKNNPERNTIPDGNAKKARARKKVQEGEQDRTSGQWRTTTTTTSFGPSSSEFLEGVQKMVKETVERGAVFNGTSKDFAGPFTDLLKHLPQYSVEITENLDSENKIQSLLIKATNIRTGKVYEATTGDKTYAQMVAEKEVMAAELESLRRYKRDRDLVRSLNQDISSENTNPKLVPWWVVGLATLVVSVAVLMMRC